MVQHQPDAVLDQANPVSGTKYLVLETTNARIISIAVWCTWTGQPTPLECHIIIDGVSIPVSQTDPVSATIYTVDNSYAAGANFSFNTALYHPSRAFLIEGRTIKIEAEITGGTVSKLEARVKFARL